MTDRDFRTLAYTKSPKTTRRTTFQDELQAAVSARASKTNTQQSSYSDDFIDDEDEFLKLLKSTRKKTSAMKGGKSKSKGKINEFELSDDEGKQSRTKKVSFLKSQRVSSPSEDTMESESRENQPPDSWHNDHNNSLSSQRSTNTSEDNTRLKSSDGDSPDHQGAKESMSKSPSFQTSEDTLLDTPLPLPTDSSTTETPGPEEKDVSALEESSQDPADELKHMEIADSVTEKEPPRPKPRQRTLGLVATEKIVEDVESQDVGRPHTSTASIPISTGTSSSIVWTEGEPSASCSFSRSSSPKSELRSTIDSRGDVISDDSKEQEGKYSTSFEEFNQESGTHSDQLSHVHDKSSDTRTSSTHSKTTQRSQSACSRNVESKYLGSLKLLDRKVSLQESQPQEADSLRAAVYQRWLQKKREKSRQNRQLKEKEEMLKEKKKRDGETKKEDAIASYEAWKARKAESLKMKAKEKQDTMRKEQRASEEKEEKRQSAQQVFEKWKQEHDHLLKEKHRVQREAEVQKREMKQEKEEERKRDSKSAFSNWCEKKKEVIHEKVTTERKDIQNKAEEERYMKEERDKMALEMYESWLTRKELEQKRKKEERRIQAILRDSPPPPWSPPNKTVPFGK